MIRQRNRHVLTSVQSLFSPLSFSSLSSLLPLSSMTLGRHHVCPPHQASRLAPVGVRDQRQPTSVTTTPLAFLPASSTWLQSRRHEYLYRTLYTHVSISPHTRVQLDASLAMRLLIFEFRNHGHAYASLDPLGLMPPKPVSYLVSGALVLANKYLGKGAPVFDRELTDVERDMLTEAGLHHLLCDPLKLVYLSRQLLPYSGKRWWTVGKY